MDKVGMIYMIFILIVIFVGAWIGLADAIERVRASMRCHEEWSAFKKHKADAKREQLDEELEVWCRRP